MSEKGSIDFQLGELKGQMTALVSTVTMLSASIDSRFSGISGSIEKLDARLRNTEADTIRLTVKIGLLGIISGGLGSLLVNYITKHAW